MAAEASTAWPRWNSSGNFPLISSSVRGMGMVPGADLDLELSLKAAIDPVPAVEEKIRSTTCPLRGQWA